MPWSMQLGLAASICSPQQGQQLGQCAVLMSNMLQLAATIQIYESCHLLLDVQVAYEMKPALLLQGPALVHTQLVGPALDNCQYYNCGSSSHRCDELQMCLHGSNKSSCCLPVAVVYVHMKEEIPRH